MDKTIVAICYDFDKTLSTSDMQSFSFIPNLDMRPEEFWHKNHEFAQKHGMESVLSYLKLMIDECERKEIKLTREYLNTLGKDIKFYEGVTTWFSRLNQYAEKQGIILEHYIISSGNKEIIEGCPIFKEFKEVYGCEFLYDKNGIACWPKNVVNYTLKTQYLFRICKGANNITDEETVNQRVSKKHVEFRNMIYIGDGLTDIPCMTLVKEKGGYAISVYAKDMIENTTKLIQDNRVNYACEGDFSSGSSLEKLMKLILDSISLKEKLIKKEQNLNLN